MGSLFELVRVERSRSFVHVGINTRNSVAVKKFDIKRFVNKLHQLNTDATKPALSIMLAHNVCVYFIRQDDRNTTEIKTYECDEQHFSKFRYRKLII